MTGCQNLEQRRARPSQSTRTHPHSRRGQGVECPVTRAPQPSSLRDQKSIPELELQGQHIWAVHLALYGTAGAPGRQQGRQAPAPRPFASRGLTHAPVPFLASFGDPGLARNVLSAPPLS